VLCCAVLCCAVLCCAVLCCAVLCCADAGLRRTSPTPQTPVAGSTPSGSAAGSPDNQQQQQQQQAPEAWTASKGIAVLDTQQVSSQQALMLTHWLLCLTLCQVQVCTVLAVEMLHLLTAGLLPSSICFVW
jgi:hypothetical protein